MHACTCTCTCTCACVRSPNPRTICWQPRIRRAILIRGHAILWPRLSPRCMAPGGGPFIYICLGMQCPPGRHLD